MAKSKTIYTCQSCGTQSPKWMGRCSNCSAWNSFIEEVPQKNKPGFFELRSEEATPLDEISLENKARFSTQIQEFDRVLGGGFVPGSLTLLGGDPGIGKSTLVLQALDQLSQQNLTVLYATGEESKAQIKIRAERLGISSKFLVVAENSLDRIIKQVEKIKPSLLIVDSIQTIYLSQLDSAPGSLSQVRECAGKLLFLSKSNSMSTLIIGHVTKEGSLAGPRVLEHLVDTVLYFEGDSKQQFRLLRGIKNRYGSTYEIGVFEMSQEGLKEITDTSSLFLSDNTEARPGCTTTASLEGQRPILVEVQALVSSSSLVNPRRTCQGVDSGRVAIIIAVLEKIAGLNLYNQDVYINAAGGFKVIEPSADCAILLSLVSSFKNKALPKDALFIGEIGLSGEIRSVNQIEIRIKEARKLGFKKFILPKSQEKYLSSSQEDLIQVESISELLDLLF